MQRLQLYRPLLSNSISQKWGENKACVSYVTRKIVNATGNTCPANTYPFYPSIGMRGHNGLDFRAYRGEKVYHAGLYDGWMKIEKDPDGGIGVDVISNEPIVMGNYTGYIKTRYWHLKTPVGHDRKQVKLGDIIGLADNTGASSGDHLHFGLKKCDKDGNAIEPNNGYNGSTDPTPYMNLNVDALAGAKYLGTPPPPLSAQEQKEIIGQLSLARQLLLALVELKRHL